MSDLFADISMYVESYLYGLDPDEKLEWEVLQVSVDYILDKIAAEANAIEQKVRDA
jgi:hypothetical protein